VASSSRDDEAGESDDMIIEVAPPRGSKGKQRAVSPPRGPVPPVPRGRGRPSGPSKASSARLACSFETDFPHS
jgi:hypothetical protein